MSSIYFRHLGEKKVKVELQYTDFFFFFKDFSARLKPGVGTPSGAATWVIGGRDSNTWPSSIIWRWLGS